MCALRVRVISVFNANYLNWGIRGFTHLLVFQKEYTNHAENGDDEVKRAAQVSIHATGSRHACMMFVHVLMQNYIC